MSFKLSIKVYLQAHGLFNGSPPSPSFAEICIHIQGCEEISVYNMIQAPRIWLRILKIILT